VRDAVNGWVRHQIEALPATYRGAIVDGRDGGTVVFPHAQLKLFITADEDIRKARRQAQHAPFGESKKDSDAKNGAKDNDQLLQERDRRDHQRSPVVPAKDAHIIDTSHLSLDEVLRIASEYVLSTIK
jgi:cytidylate kinase